MSRYTFSLKGFKEATFQFFGGGQPTHLVYGTTIVKRSQTHEKTCWNPCSGGDRGLRYLLNFLRQPGTQDSAIMAFPQAMRECSQPWDWHRLHSFLTGLYRVIFGQQIYKKIMERMVTMWTLSNSKKSCMNVRVEKRILWKLQCREIEISDAGTLFECRTVGHEIRICVLQSMPHIATTKMPHPNQHHNDATSEVFSNPINCPCVSRVYPNIFCIVPCWQVAEGTPSSVLFERIRVRVRSQQRLASPLDIIPFLGPGGKRSEVGEPWKFQWATGFGDWLGFIGVWLEHISNLLSNN